MSEQPDKFTDALKNVATSETSADELVLAGRREDASAYLKLAEAARDRINDYIAAMTKRREQEL